MLFSRRTNGSNSHISENATNFSVHLNNIIHQWLQTLVPLTFILVPIFFILDIYTMPPELLTRFGFYRVFSTFIVIIQYFVIRNTKASRFSYIHGYLISLNVGAIISLMTVDLGGFNSSYYAGLNLVIIGVNLLLPWETIHSTINSILILLMYVTFNLTSGQSYQITILINNLFFLSATAVVAVSISHVRYKLVRREFDLREELQVARDALWSEMELAKRIQTALLPDKENLHGYNIAATMHPAREVGGDYYDIIENTNDDKWVTIGDVSGHGVDSGLIMMMAQTSILSIIHNNKFSKPSAILASVNSIIRENISRMGSDHYMTLMAIRLNGSTMTFAGKHQDIIVYRSSSNKTEIVPSTGTWLGIADNIEKYLEDSSITLSRGDIVLLFTDGIIEATNNAGEMFGQDRLKNALNLYADLPVGKLLESIMRDVQAFNHEQMDDMTLVAIKKTSGAKGQSKKILKVG